MKISGSHRVQYAVALCSLVVGGIGCGPDPDKVAQDVQQRMRKDLDLRVKAEVDRRLRLALPQLEARLRAQLTNGARPQAVRSRPRPAPADPAVNPTIDPKVDPRAAAKPDPTVTAQPKADPQGLSLKRHLIAKRVVQRKPADVSTSFSVADGRLYCYLDAVNPKGPERQLSVAWIRNGKPFHAVKLRVGKGQVWRTWSRLRLRPQSVGSWHCTVSNEQGQLLSRAAFTVTK